MIGDAGGDQRMGELEEQRPRPGAEQEHRLAVERPRLGARAVESERVVGVGDPVGSSAKDRAGAGARPAKASSSRSPSDEPPRGRERGAGEEQLQDVAEDERRHALAMPWARSRSATAISHGTPIT